MGTCDHCKFWLIRRETYYAGKGEIIVNWSDPEGKGKCQGPVLKDMLTPGSFGCNAFEEGESIVVKATKTGEPWHHWDWGDCPTCHGIGVASGAGIDRNCCGTGKVRYYDDGYIGENVTCKHPNEKVLGPAPPEEQPKCFNCREPVDSRWLACPYCGTKLKNREEPVANREAVGSVL